MRKIAVFAFVAALALSGSAFAQKGGDVGGNTNITGNTNVVGVGVNTNTTALGINNNAETNIGAVGGGKGNTTIKGNTVTIHIDSAWQPDWVGTDKSRTLKLDHGILSIVTAPMTSPVDGKTYISTTTFRRVN